MLVLKNHKTNERIVCFYLLLFLTKAKEEGEERCISGLIIHFTHSK